MSKLKSLNPHKNDVVNIKFKTINQIVDQSENSYSDDEDTYELGENINAYLRGGHFIVRERVDISYPDEPDRLANTYIYVSNHLDKNYNFKIYEETIESIEIVEDADRFHSRDHKILVTRVEDEMYINGEPLIWDEDKQREIKRDKEYENPNRKLLKMFENFIADLAVKESFRDMGDN